MTKQPFSPEQVAKAAAQKIIFDNSVILLKQTCRTQAGLNIVASWYRDVLDRKMNLETCFQIGKLKADLAYIRCETVLAQAGFLSAQFNTMKQHTDLTPVIGRQSLCLRNLVDSIVEIMPKGSLLVPLAFYLGQTASTDTRPDADFRVIETARNQIMMGQKALGERVPLITFSLMDELNERASKDVDVKINPIAARINMQGGDLAEQLLAHFSPEQWEAYKKVKEKPTPDTLLANIPVLTEKMPEVFSRLQAKGVNTIQQLENFIGKGTSHENGHEISPQAALSFIEFRITSVKGKYAGQLNPLACDMADSLEIAPSIAYRNFNFKPSAASLALDQKFGFVQAITMIGDRISKNPDQLSY